MMYHMQVLRSQHSHLAFGGAAAGCSLLLGFLTGNRIMQIKK
jgi:hypothetical protein